MYTKKAKMDPNVTGKSLKIVSYRNVGSMNEWDLLEWIPRGNTKAMNQGTVNLEAVYCGMHNLVSSILHAH